MGIEPTFFGKVMSFFALAMFSSAGGVFVAFRYLTTFFVQYPFMMYVLFALELGIIFTSRIWSKKNPMNKVLFALFTFITGVTLMPLIALVASTPGGVPILFKAILATAFVFTATAIVGWTTKFDLSGLRGFLMMGLIGMIIIGVLGIFMPWGSTFELVFSGAGILLFSGFTMYDFQKLKQFPEDRYIDAALMLYLDIFNLFIYILRFMLAISGRE
jgi:FtsH-binding integral membrane protein